MKNTFSVAILILSIFIKAAEFEIVSDIKETPGDLTAIRDNVTDLNGEPCALIKISTDMEGLTFRGNIVYDKITYKDGLYKVYMLPGSFYIKFIKDGYDQIEYFFPNDLYLRSNTVYSMELKTEDKESNQVTITILTKPKGSFIIYDGEKLWHKNQISTSIGKHVLKIENYGFKTIKEDIKVTKSNTFFEYVLEPKTSKTHPYLASDSRIELVYVDQSEDKDLNEKLEISDFLIGKYEITNEQYHLVMGENTKSTVYRAESNLPIETVSWIEATDFCNKLSYIEGLEQCYKLIENTGLASWSSAYTFICDFNANGYRLPTVNEWEYVAKGSKTITKNSYSDSLSFLLKEHAWYGANSEDRSHPVGEKRPNGFGIYDMIGNVSEWCWEKDKVEQTGNSLKTCKGGNWKSKAEDCKYSAYNYEFFHQISEQGYGFRVVRNP